MSKPTTTTTTIVPAASTRAVTPKPTNEQSPKTDERELENTSLRVMLATALDALVEHGDETTEPWIREQLLKLYC